MDDRIQAEHALARPRGRRGRRTRRRGRGRRPTGNAISPVSLVNWSATAVADQRRGGGIGGESNLNADMGEGFGAYDIGDDAGLLKIIRSARHRLRVPRRRSGNDAAAGHRGRRPRGRCSARIPGSTTFWGFGRRRIDMNPPKLEYMIAYQIGALQAMARYTGAEVTHLKPHGALNNMAAEDIELALAIGRAIKTVDRDIIYVALAGSAMEKAGRDWDYQWRAKAFAAGYLLSMTAT